jgi:Lrp/AsnC family transcriptional regulator, regulator for asnA, asnC and gidA
MNQKTANEDTASPADADAPNPDGEVQGSHGAIHALEHLDELDAAILQRIQLDGRASYKAIGDDVGVSETTARNRLIRMIEDGRVQIVAILNQLASPSTHIAMAELHVSGDPMEVAREVGSWPDASFVVLTAGACDLLVEMIAVDRDGLLDAYRRLHAVPGVVSVEMNVYLKVHKLMYSGPQLL